MIRTLKFIIVRLIELFPIIHTSVYNNIHKFPFLFPHEKDYYGLELLLDKKSKGDFLDIGGNIGLSSIGFRKLGFNNKIHIFEPTEYCQSKLLKIKEKLDSITIHKYGLSSKNKKIILYTPILNKKVYHFFSSSNKNYIKRRIKKLYKTSYQNFSFKKELCYFYKFENIKKEIKPNFIKIDVEGHDFEVIRGMMPTIRKFKPLILIEYNEENFKDIFKSLNNIYKFCIYSSKNHKIIKLNKETINKLIKKKISVNHFTREKNIFLLKK